jgi:hypothetical protein
LAVTVLSLTLGLITPHPIQSRNSFDELLGVESFDRNSAGSRP